MNFEIRNMKYEFRNEKGMIMITSLLLIVVIAVFATSLFARTFSERRQIEMQTNRIVAFQMAEAGIDDAITRLANDEGYAGTSGDAVSLNSGAYSTVVNQPDSANNPEVRKIISTGYAPSNDNTQYAYQERAVTAFVELQPQPKFADAVFAENRIRFIGTTATDSYNSTLGPYGGMNVGSKGDLSSNTVETANIDLAGNSTVNGDITIGPGGDPAQVVKLSEDSSVTGDITVTESARELEPVAVPEGLSSSGDLDVTGSENEQLPAGNYLYDSVKITGGGTLTLVGPVVLYVNGSVEIAGNSVVNPGNIPSNFIVYVVGHQNVTINGNGPIYGVIYAPEAGLMSNPVTISGEAELFGAVVAYDFTASGSPSIKVHYDEALSTAGSSKKSDVAVVSWKES